MAAVLLAYAVKCIESPKGQEARESLKRAPALEQVLPPLPEPGVPAPRLVPRLAEFPAPRQAKITLAWNCETNGYDDLSCYETGLEASTDLRNWSEVAVLPYQSTNRCTLTNRPTYEFYRAFNRLKQ